MTKKRLVELTAQYQSRLSQYGPNNQATIRAEIAYREAAAELKAQQWVKRDVSGIYAFWVQGNKLHIESIVSGAAMGKAFEREGTVIWEDKDKLPEWVVKRGEEILLNP